MSSDRVQPRIGGIASPAAILMGGGIYAVVEDDAEFASQLIGATLLDACAGAGPVCLVGGPKRLEAVLAAGPARAALAGALDSGRLLALRVAPAPAEPERAARFTARLIEEVGYFCAREAALVVLDEAAELLGGAADAPRELLRQWRDWAERGRHTVLLVFRRGAGGGREPVAALLPAMPLLLGLARIRLAHQAPVWEVFHWFQGDAVSAGKSLLLARDGADGALTLREHAALRELPGPAADDELVLAARDALSPAERAPAHWQMAGALDELAARAAPARAATVLLGFSPAVSYESVARCVFALRAACGPRLKIVVREVNLRMRQSQEALALRLGANLVVPAGVNHSRFLGMVAMVQGQVFPHVLPASYEQALAEAMPQQGRGYLAPAEFTRAVAALLGRGRALRLPSALVRLPLAHGLTPLDALRHCQIRRDGDLCSADRGQLFLFLSACREGDVDLTLERLFHLPVGELFGSEQRYLTLQEIEEENAALALAAAGLPDFSAELAALERAEAGPPPALLAQTERAGAAPGRYRAPAPAIRRALALRGAQPTLEPI